ncbi:hypothetical protein [Fulvivirga sediminis]|uniref:HEAT repeat domain-containing protein n=1 Tax=Fulvivirga sediminis TaxID=2803949 RepID=A0A937F379_9BACT|nr:hypothetical protein [Fulvivirga sediminis]MBL3655506.1 hypothetical protein [Fulvivirga sediminis]
MNKGQKLLRIGHRVKLVSILTILCCLFHFSQAQNTVVSKNVHIDISDDGDGISKIRQSNGRNSFNIEYKGTITITDDDADIKSISPGGYLEISKTTFGSKRTIQIESTSYGLKKEYYEGRKEMPFIPNGKNWLAEILPEVIRSTGIGVESRVNRFYKNGGVNAVLSEMDKMESNYVKSIYARALLEKNGLKDSELVKIAESLSSDINSDYYLAEVLRKNSHVYLLNPGTEEAYFNAIKHIGSDYYSTVVLKEALKDNQKSSATVLKIMDASKNIGSDYYQMTVLNELLDDNLDEESITAIVNSSKNIHSDYYQTQLLSKALKKSNISEESRNIVIDAMADVNSDYYMASVFINLLDEKQNEATNLKIISLLENKMSSDYYASNVLSKMLKTQYLSDKGIEAIAKATSNLGSSNYASSVIKTASRQNINKKSLLIMLDTAGNIGSSFYASEALSALAPVVKKLNDREAFDAYRAAAKNINSDTYYGKAMRAID